MAKKRKTMWEKYPAPGTPERWGRLKTIRKLQEHFEFIEEHNRKLFYEPLIGNIRRHFRSRNEAFEAACVNQDYLSASPEELPRKLTLYEIRYRYVARRSLRVNHPLNRRIARRACQYFGSWDAALAAAGVPERAIPK